MENVHAFQCSEEIMEEAYAWVLKFNGDTPASNDEIAALREWAGRSPAHRQALKEAEGFWCEAELLSQLAVPLQKKQRARPGTFINASIGMLPFSGGAGSFAFIRTAVFASLLFLGLGIGFALRPISENGWVGNGIYSTAVGEQTTLTLVDASLVRLDTNSEIHVAYEEGIRKVHLLRGKAHFEVAKIPERPFEVYAREGLVRAVGTAFSVYLANSNIEVIVDEGRVDLMRVLSDASENSASPGSKQSGNNLALVVDNPAPKSNTLNDTDPHSKNLLPDSVSPAGASVTKEVFLSLEKGQGAHFDRAQQVLVQLSEKDLHNALTWRKGVLTFVRDPLSEVVYEVSRYTDITIEITDPDLRNLVMGGRFRVGELDALFEVLEIGFGVKVIYLNEHHVQLSLASNE